MNWQNSDFISVDENEAKDSTVDIIDASKDFASQNEEKTVRQLQSLQDPKKDKEIQKYISLMSQFEDLIIDIGSKEERSKDLLTEDCEGFLFNFAEIIPVKYATNREGFMRLFEDGRIIQRDVKEMFVDKEKRTGFQICFCKFFIEKSNSTIEQFSFDVISFRDEKISKYRASFGVGTSITEFQNPFEPSRKDRMLAKIKDLNYAWAGEPDLEKVASLLHESVEYKIWSWEDQKSFTFYKNNFTTDFKSIEDNYTLKTVVPYEVYSEGQFIFGTYVYYLEGKKALAGKKFMWLSTCLYKFDENLNIAKVNQQGELHLEDEVLIPFAGSSRQDLEQSIQELSQLQSSMVSMESEWGMIDNTRFNFSFESTRFGHSFAMNTGTIRGFNEYERLLRVFNAKHRHLEWMKIIDSYIDCYDPSYNTVILIDCSKGYMQLEGYAHSGKVINFYGIRKLCFENGKIAKMVTFFSDIPEEIPSPFDDPNFSSVTVKGKNA